jgi:PKD domain
MIGRSISVEAVMVVLLVFVPTAAVADTTPTTSPAGIGSLTGQGALTSLGAPGGTGGTPNGTGGSRPAPDWAASHDSSYTWVDKGPDGNYECSNGVATQVGTTFAPGSSTASPPEAYQLYDPNLNPVGAPQLVCPAVGSNGQTTAPPAPPPLPPAPAEVADFTPFPPETIRTSPCGGGVTGLATWFWATVGTGPVPPISATSSIRGYAVLVTAHPVAYVWNMGDGDVVDGTIAGTGTAQGASATYTYQTKGAYTVSLEVRWSGTYTFSGNGVPPETQALNEVAQAPRTMTFPVEEIRSVLVSPDSVTTAPATTAPVDRSHC